MTRIFTALIFVLLACSAASAQGCGPSNPNCIVADRPAGDSTGAAANTRFVTSAISSSGLSVGVSPIVGGTNTRVLFDNNGILGEYTNVQLTALCQNFSSVLSGCVPASGGGTSNFLRADGTWSASIPTLGNGLVNRSATLINNAIGLTVYNVLDNGIKCDGSTDDTTAFKNLATTIAAAGGNALIVFPSGANCIVLNSGQPFISNVFELFPWTSGAVSNVTIQGNGSTITNNHVFVAPDTFYVISCACSNLRVDGLNMVQTNGVSLPAASPYGTVGILNINATKTIVTNFSMTGGQLPILTANLQGLIAENIYSTNSVYGIANNQCNTGQSRDFFVRNLVVGGTSHDRALFLKCVSNADISLSSQNAGSNDMLLSVDAGSGAPMVNENWRINYRIVKRTSGTPISYVTIGTSGVCTTSCANAVWKNININIDADLSGDATATPLVEFIKSTASSLNLTFENITISGTVTGVPNSAANLVDIGVAVDAPWSGEVMKNISFENLQVDGSATPAFRVDYAPFSVSVPFGLSLRNVSFPGNYTDTNSSNVVTQRAAFNASFGNLFTPTAIYGSLLANNAGSGQVGEYLQSIAPHTTSTVTISQAAPGIVTWAAHGLNVASPVYLTTTGALPTGLSVNTRYYVSSQSFAAGSFALSTSVANAIAGTSITTSSAGSGTHTAHSSLFYGTADTGTVIDLTGIPLSAGDWDVTFAANYIPQSTTTTTFIAVFISSAAAPTVTPNTPGNTGTFSYANATNVQNNMTANVPRWRVNISSPSTIFFQVDWSLATANGEVAGFASVRRAR